MRACEMYRLLAIRMATQQEYEDILLYKTAASNAGQKKYRDGLSTNDKRSIRHKVQRYALQQQCLYLPEKDSTSMHRMRRVVVKQEEKSRILNMCHDGLDAWNAFWERQDLWKGIFIIISYKVQ